MPNTISGEEAAQALEAFSQAIRLQFTQNGETPRLPADLLKWKEYRSSTKSLLQALANCLGQLLPSGFTLASCKPSHILVPRAHQTDRLELLPQERAYLDLEGLPEDARLHYVHHYGTNERWLDFCHDDSHYKLTFAADEGTEVTCLHNITLDCICLVL